MSCLNCSGKVAIPYTTAVREQTNQLKSPVVFGTAGEGRERADVVVDGGGGGGDDDDDVGGEELEAPAAPGRGLGDIAALRLATPRRPRRSLVAALLADLVAPEGGLDLGGGLVQLRVRQIYVGQLVGQLLGRGGVRLLLVLGLGLLLRFVAGLACHVPPEGGLDLGGRVAQLFVVGVELRHQLFLGGFLVARLHGVLDAVLDGLLDGGLLLGGLLPGAVATEGGLDLGGGLLNLGVLEVDVWVLPGLIRRGLVAWRLRRERGAE